MGNTFLSHMSQEAHLARAIKGQLEQAVPGVEIFVSGVDVQLGQAWLEAIDNAFADARAILVLCSRRSAERPWVNFESGGGLARGFPVIPLCHGGMRKHQLPYPLRIFQGLNLDGARDCRELAQRLGTILNVEVAEDFDFDQMAKDLVMEAPNQAMKSELCSPMVRKIGR